jgi:hypothetical protein
MCRRVVEGPLPREGVAGGVFCGNVTASRGWHDCPEVTMPDAELWQQSLGGLAEGLGLCYVDAPVPLPGSPFCADVLCGMLLR